MITPKLKAKELFDKFFPNSDPKNDAKYKNTMHQKLNAIANAKIAVDEILTVLDTGTLYIEQSDEGVTSDEFWKEVLSELEKLSEVQIPFNK